VAGVTVGSRNTCYRAARYGLTRTGLAPVGLRQLLLAPSEIQAREARLGLATIRRAEQSEDQTSMTQANDLAVRNALEAAGVEFIDKNGGGPGVRLRK